MSPSLATHSKVLELSRFLMYNFSRRRFLSMCRGNKCVGRVIGAECGGYLWMPTGSLSSPNYPGLYAHARRCHWIIRAAPTQRISLTFVDLDIENRQAFGRRACIGDNVKVSSNVLNTDSVLTTVYLVSPFNSRRQYHIGADSLGQ